MKLTIRLVAMSAVFAVWTGLPALAAEGEGSPSRGDQGAQILHDLSTLGNSLVHELFSRGREIIDDHIDLDGGYRSGLHEGEHGGRLSLKLYPKGKSQSQEHVLAETWFQFFNKAGENHFSFDFKLSPSRQAYSRPEEYL
ncbi:MAG TPA: hypothetical protein VFL31_04650 [Nitrospiraceae bacterium]|nr:hypothetical protein [Nitrospiraceae bacterium]